MSGDNKMFWGAAGFLLGASFASGAIEDNIFVELTDPEKESVVTGQCDEAVVESLGNKINKQLQNMSDNDSAGYRAVVSCNSGPD